MTARYKPYSEYKPSGVEWLGDVPMGWGIARPFQKERNRISVFLDRETGKIDVRGGAARGAARMPPEPTRIGSHE